MLEMREKTNRELSTKRLPVPDPNAENNSNSHRLGLKKRRPIIEPGGKLVFSSAFVNTILSADAAETTQEFATVCRVELIVTFRTF